MTKRRRDTDRDLRDCEEALADTLQVMEQLRTENVALRQGNEEAQGLINDLHRMLARRAQEVEDCREALSSAGPSRPSTSTGNRAAAECENLLNSLRRRVILAARTRGFEGPDSMEAMLAFLSEDHPDCPFATPEEFGRAHCDADPQFVEYHNQNTSQARKSELRRQLLRRYHPDRFPQYRQCPPYITEHCFKRV